MIDQLFLDMLEAQGVSLETIYKAQRAYNLEKQEQQREAARQRQIKSRANRKDNEINDRVTPVTVTSVTSVTSPEDQTPISRENITTRAPAVIPVGISNDIPPKEIINPLVVPPAETALRKAKRAKPRTSISADRQPDDRDRDAANEAGLTLEQFRTEWRNFRNHHIAKGSQMADWSAAWRTWLGNHQKFNKSREGPTGLSRERGSLASLFGIIGKEPEDDRQQIPRKPDFEDPLFISFDGGTER